MEKKVGLIDISVPLTPDLVCWPGDPGLVTRRVCDLEAGAECTVTQLAMGVHCGTHVDAPAHFVRGGETMESLRLDLLVGRATVVELDGSGPIGAAELERALPQPPRRLLLKTRNSQLWANPCHTFSRKFIACGLDAANWLVERGVELVGIDYLSISPAEDAAEVHRVLLGAGVAVLEGLDLRAVTAGEYELICLPLRLDGCEAAPARAVLRPLVPQQP